MIILPERIVAIFKWVLMFFFSYPFQPVWLSSECTSHKKGQNFGRINDYQA